MKDVPTPAVSRENEEPTPRSARLFDTLMWFGSSVVIFLLILPVGYVSGDTVPLAKRLMEGTWLWNPNRLLMEPAAWLWLQLLSPLRLELSVPDQLSTLSMLSGAVSIAVVRGWIIPTLARRRWLANFATAWFAMSSAWSIVLLYGYPVMLQMPFLVIMAAMVIRNADGRNLWLLAFAGMAGGLSALAWISNALIVGSLGMGVGVLALKGERLRIAGTRVAIFGGSSMITLFLPMFLVWNQIVVSDLDFLSWMRSYGGGVDSKIARGYGVELGMVSIGTAMLRAGYGAAMAVVDLSPLAAWARGADLDGLRVAARIVAFLMGAITVMTLVGGIVRSRFNWARRRTELVVIMVAWILPVLAFGFLWNNSDDKFYFQLAVPLAMAVGTLDWWWTKKHWPVVVAAVIPLVFNVFDVVDRYVLYDRDGKVNALTYAYEAANLVLIPGYDDVAKLSYFVPQGGERRHAVTWFADRYTPEEGLVELERMLAEARESCTTVVVVDIMFRNAIGNPWTFLGAKEGFGLENVQRIIVTELPGIEVYERAGYTFATWPGKGGDPYCTAVSRNGAQ